MRRLILMRHAEAEPSSPTGDIGRPLSARGRIDAEAMGQALSGRGLKPDLALVSEARRAQETWDQASHAFGDVVTEFDRAIYEAGPAELRSLIEAAEERSGTLVLVGHNPAIHRLAVDLMIEQAAAPSTLERLSGGFPPGAAVIFIADTAGRLTYDGFLRPGDLA